MSLLIPEAVLTLSGLESRVYIIGSGWPEEDSTE